MIGRAIAGGGGCRRAAALAPRRAAPPTARTALGKLAVRAVRPLALETGTAPVQGEAEDLGADEAAVDAGSDRVDAGKQAGLRQPDSRLEVVDGAAENVARASSAKNGNPAASDRHRRWPALLAAMWCPPVRIRAESALRHGPS